jgi:hypothetical protein
MFGVALLLAEGVIFLVLADPSSSRVGEAIRRFAKRTQSGTAKRWYSRKYKVAGVGTTAIIAALALPQLELPYAPAFWFAYVCFGAAGIGALGEWLTSSTLQRKAKLVRRHRLNRRDYLITKWGVSIALFGATVATLTLSSYIQDRIDLSLYEGPLIPANDPNPPGPCSPNGDELALYLGKNTVKSAQFPLNAISIDHETVMKVDRTPEGYLTLSVDITSDDRRIIARIQNNVLTVNRLNVLSKKRVDKSSLIVVDQRGKEVLNARYSNPHVFRFNGIFQKGPHEVDLQRDTRISGFCLDVPKGATITEGVISY